MRDILETQEHENATLSQTQFKLLDELMKEVNRLIGVHCSETADMVRRYNVNFENSTPTPFFTDRRKEFGTLNRRSFIHRDPIFNI